MQTNQTTSMLATSGRYELLDFIRGIAILLMLIYHFCFGLSEIGIVDWHFSSHWFWQSFRSLIVFLFLSLVGIGLVLASRTKLVLSAYFKRLALLFLYASLISWLSFQVLPGEYVFFGILHLIFVSSILALLFLRFYWFNLLLGLIILTIGNFFSFEFFNQPKWQWIGLMTFKPTTNDYAPLLPWFGLVLLGIFLGHWLLSSDWAKQKLQWRAKHWFNRLLEWAGRYSLPIYFIHFQMFYLLNYLFYV